jgi:hypothetical protein
LSEATARKDKLPPCAASPRDTESYEVKNNTSTTSVEVVVEVEVVGAAVQADRAAVALLRRTDPAPPLAPLLEASKEEAERATAEE